jgi:hypothetical protein
MFCGICYIAILLGWPPFAFVACGVAILLGFVIPPAVVVWYGATKSLFGVPWRIYQIVYECDEASSRVAYGTSSSPLLCELSEPAIANRPAAFTAAAGAGGGGRGGGGAAGAGGTGGSVRVDTYQPPSVELSVDNPVRDMVPAAPATPTGRATATAPPAERSSSLLGFIGMDTGDFLNVNTVWDSFFVACGIHLREGLVDGAFKLDDLQDLEPSLYISVPALTIARALWVSG